MGNSFSLSSWWLVDRFDQSTWLSFCGIGRRLGSRGMMVQGQWVDGWEDWDYTYKTVVDIATQILLIQPCSGGFFLPSFFPLFANYIFLALYRLSRRHLYRMCFCIVHKMVHLVFSINDIPNALLGCLNQILILEHFCQQITRHEVSLLSTIFYQNVTSASEARAHTKGLVLCQSVCPGDIAPVWVPSGLVRIIPRLYCFRGLSSYKLMPKCQQ